MLNLLKIWKICVKGRSRKIRGKEVRQMKNENIKRYIREHFLSSEMKPQFAILVKGDWGCGKTFLVRDLILKDISDDKRDENDKRNKSVMYLSLYGLSDTSQISKKIFELQHPILTSKAAKFVLSLTKAVTKNAIGVDLNQDGSTDLSFDLTVPDLSIEIEGVKTQKIIVVDDLERCSIPMSEVLGFFSEAIIEKSLPVIFIGDTKKLTEDTKFQKIKEKVIGMEFEVEPDIEEAVKSFVKELSLTDYSDIFEKTASEVLRNLNYNNLRSVRQAFFGINQVLIILKKEFTEELDKNILIELIRFYLVIFIQRSEGSLDSQEVEKAIEAYSSEYKTLEKYKETHKNESYIFLGLSANVAFGKLFEKFIFKGSYDEREIVDEYQRCITPPAEKDSYQKLLYSWIELSDEEFNKCFKEVDLQIENNKILRQEYILEIASLYFKLADCKVIDCSVKKVKNKFIDYIERNKESITPYDYDYDLYFISVEKKYSKEYKEIKDLLRKINGSLQAKKIKYQWRSLIDDLPENTDAFISFIMNSSSELPLFLDVDIRKFAMQLQKIPFNEQKNVLKAFEYKYTNFQNGDIKESDIKRFEEFVNQLSESIGEFKMSPGNLRKDIIAKQYNALLDEIKKDIR